MKLNYEACPVDTFSVLPHGNLRLLHAMGFPRNTEYERDYIMGLFNV